jgi:hypothetical protein
MCSYEFFSILGNQILDPDPESGSAIRKNAGSGLNQCGSETLMRAVGVCIGDVKAQNGAMEGL